MNILKSFSILLLLSFSQAEDIERCQVLDEENGVLNGRKFTLGIADRKMRFSDIKRKFIASLLLSIKSNLNDYFLLSACELVVSGFIP